MIGGQVIDLKYEACDPNISEILTVHKLKTGALISAACLLGCIAAGADEEKLHLLQNMLISSAQLFKSRMICLMFTEMNKNSASI